MNKNDLVIQLCGVTLQNNKLFGMNLNGKHIKNAGFGINDKLNIKIENGKILIERSK
jgi:hypothetical protein